MARLKFELDNDALLRIFGGEGEASLEVREYVVQEFSRRYLKDVVNNDLFKKFEADIRTACQKEIQDRMKEYGTQTYYGGPIALSLKMKESVDKAVYAAVQGYLDRMTQETTKRLEVRVSCWEKEMHALLDRKLEAVTSDYLNKRFQEHITAISSQLAAGVKPI